MLSCTWFFCSEVQICAMHSTLHIFVAETATYMQLMYKKRNLFHLFACTLVGREKFNPDSNFRRDSPKLNKIRKYLIGFIIIMLMHKSK